MTLEQAKQELPDFEAFVKYSCDHCNAYDWYCSNPCVTLGKAKKIPFINIQEAYARHDGELWKIARYINQYKCEKERRNCWRSWGYEQVH